ncbi:MAG: glutaredoxin [Rickettsiales bacterium]|nr:glutaredoxin [Rickettsiales bacterium]|tara:strand:+ start:6370 stop:6606 length:237 start_codon:yes stop_codon:yes gene_type:complete
MIEIYGAENCSYCQQAKQLCEMKGVEYEYYDINTGNYREAMMERLETPPRTIPQIFVDDKHVEGGFTGLLEYFDKKAA